LRDAVLAVYFKGSWTKPFDPDDTKSDAQFHPTTGAPQPCKVRAGEREGRRAPPRLENFVLARC